MRYRRVCDGRELTVVSVNLFSQSGVEWSGVERNWRRYRYRQDTRSSRWWWWWYGEESGWRIEQLESRPNKNIVCVVVRCLVRTCGFMWCQEENRKRSGTTSEAKAIAKPRTTGKQTRARNDWWIDTMNNHYCMYHTSCVYDVDTYHVIRRNFNWKTIKY